MSSTNRKKLALNRETLRSLQKESLERVEGGLIASFLCSLPPTCNPRNHTCGFLCELPTVNGL